MGDSGLVGFRPPLTSVVPVAGVLIVLGVVVPFEDVWIFVTLFVVVFFAVRTRQLTVVRDEHLEVTVLRTRRIPWADIEAFEPGSRMRGGTVIRTTGGDIHAIAPCSWWGGPADPADLETLRRIRAARVGRT